MAYFYDTSNELISQSRAQIPDPKLWWIIWEVEGCWNCGGQLLVERRSPGGFFEFQRCYVCQGVGTIAYSNRTYTFDPAWYIPPNNFPLEVISNLSNIWFETGMNP